MKLKNKIISGLLTATTLVSLCAFSAGAVSTDKKFSVEDATLIQKNVVGMTTFDEKQIKLYDLNKDGVITVVDSTLVQKIIVGLIKEPTEEQPTTAESTTEPTTEAVTEPTTEAVTEPTTEAVTE
ncbi:MAG: dockerin type I repeat-containing protein, partial [Ruminococcus sp.]